MSQLKSKRYIYKGALAKPLRPDQRPEEKLTAFYIDLGATTDFEALLSFMIRPSSGFQRTGPQTRAYPSGPLRWHLKSGEKPEHKLPILYAYVGTPNPKEALFALALRHIPGFRPINLLKNGGRKISAGADVDDAWMCEIIDMMRVARPRKKLLAIAYELSQEAPPPGCENPAYGLDPNWIVQRYTNRKRYQRNANKQFARELRQLARLVESERK